MQDVQAAERWRELLLLLEHGEVAHFRQKRWGLPVQKEPQLRQEPPLSDQTQPPVHRLHQRGTAQYRGTHADRPPPKLLCAKKEREAMQRHVSRGQNWWPRNVHQLANGHRRGQT